MRVLVISNLFPPHVLGGYEILCEQVASAFHTMGYSIRVLTSKHECTEVVPYPVDRNLSLYVPFEEKATHARLRRWLTQRANHSATRHVISSFRPDIIFIWSQLRLTMGCAIAAEESNVPVAYTMNDEHIAGYVNEADGPKGSVQRLLDEQLLRIDARQLRLENVTCISNTLKASLCGKGLPLHHASVIYQGIPIDKFVSKNIPGSIGSPAALLYVGQLHEYKGVHTLIEACQLLAATQGDFRLTICGAGDSDYEKRLRQLAGRSQINVEFRGRVHHSELPAFYREHDIFVFPSIWREPFGLTHLEAMACGTTVVSTNDGGHGEFLLDGVNSLVFRAGSAADLAEKLASVLENPERSRTLAQTAQFQVVNDFSLESYVRRLEGWLQSIPRRAHPKSGAPVTIDRPGSLRVPVPTD